MNKVRWLAAVLVFFPICAAAFADEGSSAKIEPGAVDTITECELKAHINFLASEELQGRETGTDSLKVASKYIEAEFAQSSVSSAPGQKGYFQSIQLSLRTLSGSPELSLPGSTSTDNGKKSFKNEKDFTVLGFSGSGEVKAQVVFAGYGITAPENNYDDYAGLDVKGKVVLVLRYAPRFDEKGSPFGSRSEHAYLHKKYENAMKHGACAFLLVTGGKYTKDRSPSSSFFPSAGAREESGVPALHISPAVASEILGKRDLDQIEEDISKNFKPTSFQAGNVEVSVSVKMESSNAGARNVIGFIEGKDPKLSHEFIVIGAHYDHIGKHGGNVFPGADDNASGTSSLLEIAEAFALSQKKPSRSIIFIAFAGEEKGLLGSGYYVEHPLVPLSETILMINLDMVGRLEGDSVAIGGGSMSPVLEKICRDCASEEGLQPRMSQTPGGGSDHVPFFASKIPSLFVITGGHPDMHTPRDTPDKINFAGMTKIAKMVYLIANAVATLPERPKVDFSELGKGERLRGGRRPYIGANLDETQEGVKIESVMLC